MSGEVVRVPFMSLDPLSEPTLGQIIERVDAARDAGLPLDTPLMKWYNQKYLRDELVFEVVPPVASMSVQALLSESDAASPEDAERFQDEILARLMRLEEIESGAQVSPGAGA